MVTVFSVTNFLYCHVMSSNAFFSFTNNNNNKQYKYHKVLFKPQYHHTSSPYWSLYISLSSNWENLFKYQDNSSLVIIYLILMNYMHCNPLIWWGGIWWWSLIGALRVKGNNYFLQLSLERGGVPGGGRKGGGGGARQFLWSGKKKRLCT